MPSSYQRMKTCAEKNQPAECIKTKRNAYKTLVLKVVFWIHPVVYYDLNGQEAREP